MYWVTLTFLDGLVWWTCEMIRHSLPESGPLCSTCKASTKTMAMSSRSLHQLHLSIFWRAQELNWIPLSVNDWPMVYDKLDGRIIGAFYVSCLSYMSADWIDSPALSLGNVRNGVTSTRWPTWGDSPEEQLERPMSPLWWLGVCRRGSRRVYTLTSPSSVHCACQRACVHPINIKAFCFFISTLSARPRSRKPRGFIWAICQGVLIAFHFVLWCIWDILLMQSYLTGTITVFWKLPNPKQCRVSET